MSVAALLYRPFSHTYCQAAGRRSVWRNFTVAQRHQGFGFFRGFAQSAKQLVPPQSKPKPKASTPLRRTAAASLPIRSNPTPTRSEIQPVFTLATAERYLLPQLQRRLPPSSQILHDSLWVPSWSRNGKEGEIFIFANGSFVCWGLGEAEAAEFARETLSKEDVEIGQLKESETEDLEFVTDPSECVLFPL